MKHCADTWFILLISKEDDKALSILREVTDGKDRLVIPSVVIAEFTKESLRKGRSMEDVTKTLDSFKRTPKIEIIHTTDEIVTDAGKFSLTFQMPMIDAIIASTAKNLSCDSILSDDEHYEKFCKQNKIKLMRW